MAIPETALSEFFARTLPPSRGFLMAAGLAQVLDFLETLRFWSVVLAWLESTGRFNKKLLDYFESFRFIGDVHAMPEGSIFFPNEPILPP